VGAVLAPHRLSPAAQRAVAQVFREFADAAGEVPDSQWLAAVPVGEDPAPRRRPPVQGQVVSPARGRVNVKEQA